jgi:hypothetical protein
LGRASLGLQLALELVGDLAQDGRKAAHNVLGSDDA